MSFLNGKTKRSFKGAQSAAFFENNRSIVLGYRDGIAEIWSIEPVRRTKVLRTTSKNSGLIWSLTLSKNNQYIMGGDLFDEKIYVWSVTTGRIVRSLEMDETRAHYRHASAIAMSRDGKLVVAGLAQRAVSSGDEGDESGGILVWDMATGELRFTLRGHEGAVRAITFSPDDRWINRRHYD